MSNWFDEARFGMFVHWDHASQQGLEISWPMVGGVFALPGSGNVSVEQYQGSAESFDPTQWDAPALARTAREAGMTYAVLTAKHHAGYAMWPTALSDFSVANSPCERDLVGEFVTAVRGEGLRVGLYFSLSDWHHPDYPAFTDADKPYVFSQSPPAPTDEQWERYWTFLVGQLEELLTSYGPIDELWFDGGWERPPERWRPGELETRIRTWQPEILINDRLFGVGDFDTPEQFVPSHPPPRRWETCMTMNESWGYHPVDSNYKSARRLVHTLCEVAGRGGNLLLNVSPRGDGSLPPEQTERLQEFRRWMGLHRESIIATRPGLQPWQFYGPSTREESRVYLHLLLRPYEEITVRGVPIRRVRAVTILATGRPLDFTTRTGILEHLIPDPLGELSVRVSDELLDPSATVIAVDFEGPLDDA